MPTEHPEKLSKKAIENLYKALETLTPGHGENRVKKDDKDVLIYKYEPGKFSIVYQPGSDEEIESALIERKQAKALFISIVFFVRVFSLVKNSIYLGPFHGDINYDFFHYCIEQTLCSKDKNIVDAGKLLARALGEHLFRFLTDFVAMSGEHGKRLNRDFHNKLFVDALRLGCKKAVMCCSEALWESAKTSFATDYPKLAEASRIQVIQYAFNKAAKGDDPFITFYELQTALPELLSGSPLMVEIWQQLLADYLKVMVADPEAGFSKKTTPGLAFLAELDRENFIQAMCRLPADGIITFFKTDNLIRRALFKVRKDHKCCAVYRTVGEFVKGELIDGEPASRVVAVCKAYEAEQQYSAKVRARERQPFDRLASKAALVSLANAGFASEKNRLVDTVVLLKDDLGKDYPTMMDELMRCKDEYDLHRFDDKYGDVIRMANRQMMDFL